MGDRRPSPLLTNMPSKVCYNACMTDSLILLLALAITAAGYCAFGWRRTAAAKAAGDRDVAEARTRLEQLDTLRAERDQALSEAKQVAIELAAERSAGAARALSFTEKE